MRQSEIEQRVISVLGRYSALDHEALKSIVLLEVGEWSHANEAAFTKALDALTKRGAVQSGGRFGPYQLAQPAGSRSIKYPRAVPGRSAHVP